MEISKFLGTIIIFGLVYMFYIYFFLQSIFLKIKYRLTLLIKLTNNKRKENKLRRNLK